MSTAEFNSWYAFWRSDPFGTIRLDQVRTHLQAQMVNLWTTGRRWKPKDFAIEYGTPQQSARQMEMMLKHHVLVHNKRIEREKARAG